MMKANLSNFRPKIIGFLCTWCSYEGADSAGRARKPYPPNLIPVRVLCSGRIDPQFVLEAFKEGADGVMMLGCRPGDCHYKEGNIQALKRFEILKIVLQQFGVESDRLRIAGISAGEYEKFIQLVTEMVDKITKLGPLQR
jgi:F420-non-reducing hydrogenase iron-sulfur subunit